MPPQPPSMPVPLLQSRLRRRPEVSRAGWSGRWWTEVGLGVPSEATAGPASAADPLQRDPGLLVALAFGLHGFQHQFFGYLADRAAQRPGRIP